jgi:hypothetical protein
VGRRKLAGQEIGNSFLIIIMTNFRIAIATKGEIS